MEASSIGLAVAFAAGLLSFLSPCVFPLIPSYVTFITGMSLDELVDEEADRRRVRQNILIHGSLFILGFTLVFVIMGASATFLGSLFLYSRDWLEKIGGILLIIFGLYLLGVLRIPGAERDWRMHLGQKPMGFLGTTLVGVTFGAGWSPCMGPVLGGIMTMAAASGSVSTGVGLLLIYSAGLAIPFLAAALLLRQFLGGMKSISRWLPWVNRISGGILLVLGILMVSGAFTILNSLLNNWTPEFIRDRI